MSKKSELSLHFTSLLLFSITCEKRKEKEMSLYFTIEKNELNNWREKI